MGMIANKKPRVTFANLKKHGACLISPGESANRLTGVYSLSLSLEICLVFIFMYGFSFLASATLNIQPKKGEVKGNFFIGYVNRNDRRARNKD